MSLSRAFTTRRSKAGTEHSESNKGLHRSNTTSGKAPRSIRDQISAPVQLVHTTNMLSYDAPDLPRSTRSNSVRTASDDDSASQRTEETTPPTSPDMSPSDAPGKQQTSSYFLPQKRLFSAVQDSITEEPAPAIPKRSPSHTKKNSSEALARHRSLRMSKESTHSRQHSNTFSTASTTSTDASSTSHHSMAVKPSTASLQPQSASSNEKRREIQASHPFGQELEQVSELAEDYVSHNKLSTIPEDMEYIQSNGLRQWSASEYLGEITHLYNTFFPEALKPQAAPLWI